MLLLLWLAVAGCCGWLAWLAVEGVRVGWLVCLGWLLGWLVGV